MMNRPKTIEEAATAYREALAQNDRAWDATTAARQEVAKADRAHDEAREELNRAQHWLQEVAAGRTCQCELCVEDAMLESA